MRVALLVLLTACALDTPLPPAPVAAGPIVSHIEPGAAHAGNAVVLHGTHLGTEPNAITVEFDAVAVHPIGAAPDGSWLRVIVPDAAYGHAEVQVLVTTPDGVTPGTTSFDFLGGDRLRMGQVAFERGLGPIYLHAAPLPVPNRFLAVAARLRLHGDTARLEQEFLVSDGVASLEPLRLDLGASELTVEELAASSDGRVVVALSRAALGSCDPAQATLAYFDGATIAAGTLRPTRLRCLPALDPSVSLVLSPSGDTALVVSPDRAWIDGAHGLVQIEPTSASSEFDEGALLFSGDAVLLESPPGGEARLALVDSAGVEKEHAKVDAIDPDLGLVDRLIASPDGRLLLTADRAVLVLDPTVWPPAVQRRLEATQSAWRAAITADGQHIAALSFDGTVELFDLTEPSPLPTAHRRVGTSESLRADPFGSVVVATRGGLLRLDPRTGDVLSQQVKYAGPIGLAWTRPVERALGEGFAATTELVVVSGSTGELGRYRAAPTIDDPLQDLSTWEPTEESPVGGAAHSLDGRTHVITGDALRVYREGEPPSAPIVDDDVVPFERVGLSPDGSAAVVVGGYPSVVRIYETAPLLKERARLALTSLAAEALDLHVFTNGRALVTDGRKAVIFDWDAHAGDASRRLEVTLAAERVGAWALADGLVYSDEKNHVFWLDLETGTSAPAGQLPAALPVLVPAIASPGGTRLYWTVQERLLSAVFDPVKHRVGAPFPPVVLPAGTQIAELAMSPDGEGLALLEPAHDRILVVR